jgi:predicted kinase
VTVVRMNNSKLIFLLIASLPGAGKTTLASGLSRYLRWNVIDEDKLKEGLLQQGMDDEQVGFATYKQSFDAARDALMVQQSVILDSAALHPFILDNAKEIVDNVENAQLKVILCMADRDLRNERLRKRPAQITTIDVDPATIADYYQIFRHLPGDTFVLYTNRPLEECLAEVKRYLDA